MVAPSKVFSPMVSHFGLVDIVCGGGEMAAAVVARSLPLGS